MYTPSKPSRSASGQLAEFVGKLGAHALIGIKRQHPFGADRQVRQRPLPLRGMRFERDARRRVAPLLLGDVPRPIGATGVDDEDLVRPPADGGETALAGCASSFNVRMTTESGQDAIAAVFIVGTCNGTSGRLERFSFRCR